MDIRSLSLKKHSRSSLLTTANLTSICHRLPFRGHTVGQADLTLSFSQVKFFWHDIGIMDTSWRAALILSDALYEALLGLDFNTTAKLGIIAKVVIGLREVLARRQRLGYRDIDITAIASCIACSLVWFWQWSTDQVPLFTVWILLDDCQFRSPSWAGVRAGRGIVGRRWRLDHIELELYIMVDLLKYGII